MWFLTSRAVYCKQKSINMKDFIYLFLNLFLLVGGYLFYNIVVFFVVH